MAGEFPRSIRQCGTADLHQVLLFGGPMNNSTSDDVRMLARAIHEALRMANPDAFVAPLRETKRTTIDGRFDLQEVAARVLETLSQEGCAGVAGTSNAA
jgi:hypothetical protein